MMGTWISFAMRTFLSHQEVSQGRKKFETTAAQEKPILSAKFIKKNALSILRLSPSIKAMRLQPIVAKNVMLAVPSMTLPLIQVVSPSSENETLIMKCASVMYLVGAALSLKDWYQGRHKSPPDDATPMTRQAKALQWVRQAKNLSFVLSSMAWLGNFNTGVTKLGSHLGMALTLCEVFLVWPISVERSLRYSGGISMIVAQLFEKNSPVASELIYSLINNFGLRLSYAAVMWPREGLYGRTSQTTAAKTA